MFIEYQLKILIYQVYRLEFPYAYNIVIFLLLCGSDSSLTCLALL